MTCPSCGLALPPVARFCARCGAPQGAGAARAGGAPVWLLVLLWLGAAGLLWIAALYGVIAAGLISPRTVGSTVDPAQVGPASAVLAVCAASLGAAHVVAALGLMGNRAWARTFATLVCVVWALTCVGLPVGLLGIAALWRTRRPAGQAGPSGPARTIR